MIRRFFDPRQLAHAPALELHNGAYVPHAETPCRAKSIVAALNGFELPSDHGEATIRAESP